LRREGTNTDLLKKFARQYDSIYGEDGIRTWMWFWDIDDKKTEVVIFMLFGADIVVIKNCFLHSEEDQIARSIIGNDSIAT
jgi:hypothetical protein